VVADPPQIDFEKREQTGPVTNSKAHINEFIEGSTARLGTVPDLYYLHRIDANTPLEESIGALDGLKKAGKCKYIGLSECSADTLRKACSSESGVIQDWRQSPAVCTGARLMGYIVAHIDALQIEYSPWCLDHESDGVIDAARELGVTIIAYSPLGRGVLTGKFRDASLFQGPNDNRGTIPKYGAEMLPANLRLVDELEAIAKTKGCSVGQLCIAWVAAMGAIPIPGTKRVDRLEENWASREVELTKEDLDKIRGIITASAPQGAR
jgi:aryl-alcohol dehydrogenase-like predicted oxidoreductase